VPKLTQRERIDSQLFEFPLSNTFEQRPHSHAVAVAEYNNECNSVNEARPALRLPSSQISYFWVFWFALRVCTTVACHFACKEQTLGLCPRRSLFRRLRREAGRGPKRERGRHGPRIACL
jgi:hypothetical protein